VVQFEALAAMGPELQDWDLASGALEARGSALQKLRRWAESASSLREGLLVAWDGLEMQATVCALWNVAPALARLRHAVLAAQTEGAAEAQRLQRFGAKDQRDRSDVKRIRRFTRVLLGAEAAQRALAGRCRPHPGPGDAGGSAGDTQAAGIDQARRWVKRHAGAPDQATSNRQRQTGNVKQGTSTRQRQPGRVNRAGSTGQRQSLLDRHALQR